MNDRTNDILASALREKKQRRRRFAAATFAEKIAIVERLREELRPLKRAKFVRTQNGATQTQDDQV